MLNDLIHVHVKCGARVADMHFHADATLAEFKEQICKEFVLGDSTLRILHRGKALPVGDTERDQQLSSAQLSSLEIENNAKLYVMATSAKSRADVANHVPERMRGFEEDDNRIMTGGVSTSKRYGSVSVRSTASRPSFRFHALQALEVPASAHPRKEAAERRLRELAEDPAVLAILAEHRWNVGALKGKASPRRAAGSDQISPVHDLCIAIGVRNRSFLISRYRCCPSAADVLLAGLYLHACGDLQITCSVCMPMFKRAGILLPQKCHPRVLLGCPNLA
eukprot:6197037-Pleurochrysis_carterae.AAC.1